MIIAFKYAILMIFFLKINGLKIAGQVNIKKYIRNAVVLKISMLFGAQWKCKHFD